MNLDSTWREARTGLSMTDGESCVVEFHGPVSAIVRPLDVEGAGPPPSDEEAL